MKLLAPQSAPAQRVVALDDYQKQVLNRVLAGAELLIAGAPGTGKTAILEQAVVQVLRRTTATSPPVGVEPVLLLAPSRRVAGKLRNRINPQLASPITTPVVRTASSLAFAILNRLALARGEAPPKLISGPEQDRILADLLAGHLAGDGIPLALPEPLKPEVLLMRGFRHELRDLLMRVREHSVTPTMLSDIGRQWHRPMWVLAGEIYREYEANLALRALAAHGSRQLDPASVISSAAAVLRDWGQLTDAAAPRFAMVLVDDYQEATAATAGLLAVLQQDGSQLVVAGDPNLTTQSFRGANPALFGRAALPKRSELGAFGLAECVLPKVWRHTAPIRDSVIQITSRVPTLGAPITTKAPAANETNDVAGVATSGVKVVKLRGAAQEAAWIAHTLRAEHYLHGTEWTQMAIICRSGAQLASIRRELLAAGVPVETLGSDVPLHEEPAVSPILSVLRLVIGEDQLTIEVLLDLLMSPIGGMDAIAIRRLRQALIAAERSIGGTRTSEQLLLAAVQDAAMPKLAGDEFAGLTRVSRALHAGQEAFAVDADTAEVLWAVWAATDLAEHWRNAALAGGSLGVRADRNLDAMMGLFKAAEFFAERNPGAGPLRFIEYLSSQDVPADSLAAQANHNAVAVLTPAGAVGGEWDVVVVAGVQEGVWPDVRLRDSMFGTQTLVDVLGGRVSEPDLGVSRAQAATPLAPGTPSSPLSLGYDTSMFRDIVAARGEVLADETRAFAMATSRAKRRLIVTAVDGPDDVPSTYLDWIASDVKLVEPSLPLDLRGLVTTA